MKVSVVMASMNPDKKMLASAINSVLKQTYTEFDFIIVDDGSKEPLEGIVRKISSDSRIRLYRIPNSGLGAALNHGILQSDSEYIARLDDDDLMCPTRLEKQVKFMDAHPEASCVGTWHYDMANGRYLKHRPYPIKHDDIVVSMLSHRWALAHTTLMFRRNLFHKFGGYRIPGGGQDIDLILQLSIVGKLANIPEYLTYYRMATSGLSQTNPKRVDAYLFAYEDVLRYNNFPQHQDIIDKTITRLKESKRKANGKKRFSLGRWLLVQRVLLFGRRIKA